MTSEYHLGQTYSVASWTEHDLFWLFSKLGIFLMTLSAIFAQKRHILNNVVSKCMGFVVISPFPKHMCRRKPKSISLLSLVFMLLVEIFSVSLNSLEKRDKTRHNLKIEALMEKMPIPLYSRHLSNSKDTSARWFHGSKVVYLNYFLNLGFAQ